MFLVSRHRFSRTRNPMEGFWKVSEQYGSGNPVKKDVFLAFLMFLAVFHHNFGQNWARVMILASIHRFSRTRNPMEGFWKVSEQQGSGNPVKKDVFQAFLTYLAFFHYNFWQNWARVMILVSIHRFSRTMHRMDLFWKASEQQGSGNPVKISLFATFQRNFWHNWARVLFLVSIHRFSRTGNRREKFWKLSGAQGCQI